MSCWLFFTVLWFSGGASGGAIPAGCHGYVDDPGIMETVVLPRYIEGDEIDRNGDAFWSVVV